MVHQLYWDIFFSDGPHHHHHHYDRDHHTNPGTNGSVTGSQWVGMDNPEYHIMNSHSRMYNAASRPHTLGVPVLQHGHFHPFNSVSSSGHSSVNSNANQNIQHGRSSPSPPAHDYYNELSHVSHRGPRSETTV